MASSLRRTLRSAGSGEAVDPGTSSPTNGSDISRIQLSCARTSGQRPIR